MQYNSTMLHANQLEVFPSKRIIPSDAFTWEKAPEFPYCSARETLALGKPGHPG